MWKDIIANKIIKESKPIKFNLSTPLPIIVV